MARLALNCVGSAVPTKDVPEYWASELRLLPHARKCLEPIHRGVDVQPAENQNICRPIHNLGDLYSSQGQMQEAEAMYRRALGTRAYLTLDKADNLAILYTNHGRMHEAEAMHQRALEGYEKALNRRTRRRWTRSKT